MAQAPEVPRWPLSPAPIPSRSSPVPEQRSISRVESRLPRRQRQIIRIGTAFFQHQERASPRYRPASPPTFEPAACGFVFRNEVIDARIGCVRVQRGPETGKDREQSHIQPPTMRRKGTTADQLATPAGAGRQARTAIRAGTRCQCLVSLLPPIAGIHQRRAESSCRSASENRRNPGNCRTEGLESISRLNRCVLH